MSLATTTMPVGFDPPVIRLFQSERQSPGGLSPAMRLSELFERFFLPVMLSPAGASADTVIDYRASVGHWVNLTGDPPLLAIDDYTAAAFSAGLSALPGRKGALLAPYTVRKHVRNVQRVLNHAGPRVANCRTARRYQSLLDEVPLIDRPSVDHEPPDGDFTFDEIAKIVATCMSLPPRAPRLKQTGVPPATWWRSLVIFLFYSGLRIGATMSLEWSAIDGDWIRVPSRGSKGRRGKKQFLLPEAREAIEPLRRGQARIFAWPNWVEKKCRRRSMARAFELLLARAGLPEERRFGFHGFRKAHATQLAGINPLAAQLSLGHTNMRTTQEHYVNHKIAAEAIKQMPSLRAAAKSSDSRQKRLF